MEQLCLIEPIKPRKLTMFRNNIKSLAIFNGKHFLAISYIHYGNIVLYCIIKTNRNINNHQYFLFERWQKTANDQLRCYFGNMIIHVSQTTNIRKIPTFCMLTYICIFKNNSKTYLLTTFSLGVIRCLQTILFYYTF